MGNESRLEVPNIDQPTPGDYPSQLFLNNGDGTFTEGDGALQMGGGRAG